MLAAALPDNAGYVAAAYLVFFALVVIYLAIMAAKLSRLERELGELNELADRLQPPEGTAPDEAVAPEGSVAP
jgi:CcmD family protein